MTAGEYKPLTRKFLCPKCGTEQRFRNSAEAPTRWKCQGPGCPVVCIQDTRGTEEPCFEGHLGVDLGELEFVDESAVGLYEPDAPAVLNLSGVFDLSLPLVDRVKEFGSLFSAAAEAMVERDEAENPAPYTDPDFRRQSVARLELKGITDAQVALNQLVLHWTMEHGEEVWIDADGCEVTLQEVIEEQMPSEEQHKSSGRARQVASFKDRTIDAFREAGIPDQRIAECNNSGMSSVLGIVSSAQRKLEKSTPPDELPERYDDLIQAASEATSLDGLKQEVKKILDPEYEPPPPLLYSVENDVEESDHCWVLLKPTHDQFVDIVLPAVKGVGEIDKQLPEYFYRYWGSFITVPAGQGGDE